tara:strand:+ start:10794 stop:11873 length:1080 start_codon:yes stop_codon:yes gene_type:complete
MKEYTFDKDFIKRISIFLSSPEYLKHKEHSKSEYWKKHSSLFNIKILDNKVIISGSSGFYEPNQNKIKRIFGSPIFFLKKILLKLFSKIGFTDLISPEVAFNNLNAFNRKDKNSEPYSKFFGANSSFRLDHYKIAEKSGAFKSIKHIKRAVKNRYSLNFQMIYSYYIFNILNYFIVNKRNKTILEIGGGSGNLLSVLFDNFDAATLIDVDLPETLSSAIFFIKDLYPNAKILMPNEANNKNFNDYDFVFLTPSQINLLQEDSLDIAVNICSFQEMTKEQVSEYFNFLDKSVKHTGVFLSTNRAEKFAAPNTNGSLENEPSRFSNYPWREKNKILAFEVCPLFHQVNPNCHFMRIDSFNK